MDTKKSILSFAVMKEYYTKYGNISLAYCPFIEYALSESATQIIELKEIHEKANKISGLSIPYFIIKEILRELEKQQKITCSNNYETIEYKAKEDKEKYRVCFHEKEVANNTFIRELNEYLALGYSDS
jgi:hypothetical protein